MLDDRSPQLDYSFESTPSMDQLDLSQYVRASKNPKHVRGLSLLDEAHCVYGFVDHHDSTCQPCLYQLLDVSLYYRASDGGSFCPHILCSYIQSSNGIVPEPLPMGLHAVVFMLLCLGDSCLLLPLANVRISAYGRFQLG